MENQDTKVRSIRADEVTLEKFKALSEDFGSQGDCLKGLITAYELNNAKHILTDVKTDIADFEGLMNSIQQAYLHALELNCNAEQRIRQEFANALASKDKIIEGLQSRSEAAEQLVENTRVECQGQIQNATDELTSTINELEITKEELLNKKQACEQAESSLADKQIIINSLNRQIEQLIGADERAKRAEEQKNNALSAQAKAEAKAQELERQLAELKVFSEKALQEQQRTSEQAQELMKEKSAVALERAVVEAEKAAQEQIKELVIQKDKQSELIAALKSEIADLKIQNERIKK